MQCLACGGPLQWAGPNARCPYCQAQFAHQNGQLVAVVGAPQHNLAAGTFDLGDGHQLRVKINGKSPEDFLKNKASNMIWGWILGAVMIVIVVVVVVGLGIYIYAKAGASAPVKAPVATWDGKSTLECKGNDTLAIAGVTATAGIKATANCQLTLTGVNITAPVAIEASGNAKVIMTGGSITASTHSVVASASAKVDLVGTKVVGKSKASNAAKITGAP